MSEKLYVRRCEKYTIWEATEELWSYLEANVYNWETSEDFFDNNKKVYGEEELQNLLLEDGYHDRKIYSDSREKFGDDWVEIGHLNEEYRKTGGFQSLHDNGNW